MAIALGDTEQPVQPVPRGRHGPRPPSLRAEVVEVGVDGDADRAIVRLVAERVDVCLGGLSRRKAARSALAFSRMCSVTVGCNDDDAPPAAMAEGAVDLVRWLSGHWSSP